MNNRPPLIQHDLRGGRRAGAGRPCSDNVEISITLSRTTFAKLLRMASAAGLSRRPGGQPFLGTIVNRLVAKEPDPDEPAYLKLARSLQTVSAA